MPINELIKFKIIPFLLLSLLLTPHLSAQNSNSKSTWKYSNTIKYVKGDSLIVYRGADSNSKINEILNPLDKVIVLVDSTIDKQNEFVKLVYPTVGYVCYDNLINEKEADEIFAEGDIRSNFINNKINGWALSVLDENQGVEKYKEEGIGKYFETKGAKIKNSLIITHNITWYPDSMITVKWVKKFDKNKDGYLTFASLLFSINSDDFKQRELKAKVFYREEKQSNYKYYFTTKKFVIPDSDSKNRAIFNVGTRGKELPRGSYNFRVDIYETETFALLATLNPRFENLSGVKFETEIYSDDEIDYEEIEGTEAVEEEAQVIDSPIFEEPTHQFTLFGAWSPYTAPVERVFDSKKFSYGGNFEYKKSNWCFGFGLGYNKSTNNENIDSTNFGTETFYGYAKLSLLKMAENFLDFHIDEDLDVYVNVGAAYWKTEFQKIKYDGIKEDYNIIMNDKGWGYLLSAGAMYNLYNFQIGIQYQLLHSGLGHFSKTIKIGGIDLTDKYDLYTGTNQIQIILGYRLEL